MDKQKERHFFPVKPIKSLWVSLINGFLILVTSLGLYLGVYNSIRNEVYKTQIQSNKDSYQTVLSVGRSSYLMMTDETNTTEYSFENYYDKFLAEFLKTYYSDPSYNMDEDPDGYKTAEDKLEDFQTITIENDVVKDGFLGEFYTSFAITRLDTNGNQLWTPTESSKVLSFYNSILQINDVEKGGKFFTSPDSNNLIHLKDDVRIALLGYTVIGLTKLEWAQIDKEFYNYFKEVFVAASNLLLTDSVYSFAYKTFSETNDFLIKNDAFAGISILLSSIVVFVFVTSLFNKEGKNIANLLSKTSYITEEEKFPILNRLLLLLSAVIKYFHIFLVIFAFGNPDVLTTTLVQIQSLKITPSIFGVISLIYCVVSIVVSLVGADNKNLDAIISRTYLVTEVKNLSESNTYSDTDLV